MKNKLATREKIMIGVVVLFLITPILASLSYAEFVEHLWPIELSSQKLWYELGSEHQLSTVSDNPFVHTSYNPAFQITETQNPYVIVAVTGILGVSFYLVFREGETPKKIHSA